MTDQRELDRILGAFFAEGTDELADRVIDAALDQVGRTSQRRAMRVPRKLLAMPMPARLAAVAVIGVVAVGAALFLGVAGAGLASNIDNVVRLFVYRRVSGIHPMLTLVGAFAGIRLFGLVGAFLGPLILSYFFELLRIFEESTRAGDTAAILPMKHNGA